MPKKVVNPAPKKTKVVAPSQFALCRNLCDGDIVAATLLYRLLCLWWFRKKKLKRFSKEWIAMSRDDWALSAGLTRSEIKDRALPRLRKSCSGFVEVRTMRLGFGHVNMIWMSLDIVAMPEYLMPHDAFEDQLNGMGIYPKSEWYLYKHGEE